MNDMNEREAFRKGVVSGILWGYAIGLLLSLALAIYYLFTHYVLL